MKVLLKKRRKAGRLEELLPLFFPFFHSSILPALFFLLFSFSGNAQSVTTINSGSGNWTVPCNVTSLQVECWGGGGGGGGDNNAAPGTSGSGGGGGGYCIATMTVTPGQLIAYSVGTAGIGGGAGGTGFSGGNTNFSTVIANGGSGGAANNGPGGFGGSGSGGVVTPGMSGQNGNTIAGWSGSGGLAGNMGVGNGMGRNTDGDGNIGSPNSGCGGGGGQHLGTAGTNSGGMGGNGVIKITFSQPGGTYSIGPTGNYPSITASITALQCAAITGPIVFELQPAYSDAVETYPISFPVILGVSAVNTITYRPAAGATNLVCDGDPGSGLALFTLSGMNYLTLDGRPGGSGTSQWTIRNTRTTTAASVGNTFTFLNEASNNKLTYLNIEGQASSTNAIILFSSTTGSNGNDNNIVSFCTIGDLTVGGTAVFPCTGIYSAGTATKANSGNTIDNNQFIDIYNPSGAISSGIEISANNDVWSITNNHFYQGSGAYTNLITNVWSAIYMSSGGGYTVTGNFIGGRGPNCSGAAFNITSGTSQMLGMRFTALSGAACTVSGNTIANVSYTTTGTSAGVYPIVGISLGGSVNYVCGSSGNGNTIGSMSTLNSIVATNNAASGSAGFVGIFHSGNGTCSIAYNNFGGIKQQGSRTDADVDLISLSTGTGAVTITNNTFGSTLANSLEVASSSIFTAIYNSGNSSGISCSNNTFQNLSLSLASGINNLYGVVNFSGPLVLINNAFKNFSSAHDGICSVVRHDGGTTANIDGNTFQDITLSNTGASALLYGIDLNSASGTVVNANTFGSTIPGNILVSGNDDNFIIYKTGTGSLTMTGNMIQGISFVNGGINTGFEAVLCAQGPFTCTGNTIRNISVNTTSASDFAAIWSSSASVGIMISNNYIENIAYSSAAVAATLNRGIYVLNGSGNITKNFIAKLSNSSTSPTGKIIGAELFNGSWSFNNNVVLLDNNAGTNSVIIYGVAVPSVNAINVYHNTIKIYGSQSGNSVSACSFRTGNNVFNTKNNLFQNLRTGGTGGHYTEYVNPIAGTYITDHNYLEASDPSKLCNYGGANNTLAAWKTNTLANNSMSGFTTLNAIGAAPSGFAGANMGFDLATPLIVTDDKLSNARPTAPWMGAYEGTFLAPSISTDAITPSILCRGGNITVTYTLTGTFSAGNIFTAELSAANGSFSVTTTLGSVASTTNTPISASIPAGISPGTLYRIRVISSSPAVNGTDNGTNLTIPADGGAGTWTWTGSVSNNWFDRCNWNVKCLPDANSDVIVPASGTPAITGAGAFCNTLTIASSLGAVLTIDSSGGGSLTITQ